MQRQLLNAGTETVDRRFAELLDELTDLWRSGRIASLPEAMERFPDYARRLEELWPALEPVLGLGEPPPLAETSPGVLLGGIAARREVGDFRIIREIGRGGMGIVYEAEQLSLARRVALKVLPLAALLDPSALRRFKNEARFAAVLDHPNIVKIYAVGSEGGIPYFAMQLIHGRSLAEVIRPLRVCRNHPATLSHLKTRAWITSDADSPALESAPAVNGSPACCGDTARSQPNTDSRASSASDIQYIRSATHLAIQACEALEYAHAQGVTHRDIKPANLLVSDAGRLWIADFGLARVATDPGLTATGNVLGTVRYMSLEQALGRVVDHRSDIYSLGATLYELVTLEPLIPDGARESMLHAITSGTPRAPRRVAPGVPRDLETIILKATAKEPHERYPTARHMADDLRCFLEHKPIAARRPSLIDRGLKWTRRNGVTLTASLATAAMVLIAALALVWDQRQEAFQQRQRAVEEAERANELAEGLREHVYAADMKLANEAWWKGDLRRLLALLNRHVPAAGERDLRGFEWRFLRRQVQHEGISIQASPEALYWVRHSPDGRLIAVAGKDAIVRVYDSQTFQPAFELATGQIEVNCAVFSLDGRTLATTGDDGTVRVWDIASRRERFKINAHPGKAYQVVFSPDGSRIFSCGDEPIIRVWKSRNGQPVYAWKNVAGDAVECLAHSPVSTVVAYGTHDGNAILFDLRGMKTRQVKMSLGKVASVAFSPDGALWGAASATQGTLVWDVNTGDLVRQIARPDATLDLKFSPDGKSIVTADWAGVMGIMPCAGEPALQGQGDAAQPGDAGSEPWQAHQGRAYSVSWSPTGEHFASVGADGTLRIWPAAPEPRFRKIAPDHGLHDFAFTSDSKALLSSEPHGCLHEYEITGEFRGRRDLDPGEWNRIALSPSGAKLAASALEGSVAFWDLREQKLMARRDHPQFDGGRIVFAPDGKSVALTVASAEACIHVLDAATGDTICAFPGESRPFSLAFSPDGKYLAYGADDAQRTIHIWDLARRQEILALRGHSLGVNELVFGPDGSWLASVAGRSLRVWDLPSGALRFSAIEHTHTIRSLACSPDGRTLATGDGAGIVKLWSVAAGQVLCEVTRVPGESIWKLAFSPDGRCLAWRQGHELIVCDVGEVPSAEPQ